MSFLVLLQLVVVGSVVTYLWSLFWLGLWSRRWPVAKGVVTRSSVSQAHKRDRGSYSLNYEYHVNGKVYRSGRYRFGHAIGGVLNEARSVAAGYPTGHEVQVRYCPVWPSIATLQPKVSFYLWPTLIVLTMLLFVLFGAAMGWIPENGAPTNGVEE